MQRRVAVKYDKGVMIISYRIHYLWHYWSLTSGLRIFLGILTCISLPQPLGCSISQLTTCACATISSRSPSSLILPRGWLRPVGSFLAFWARVAAWGRSARNRCCWGNDRWGCLFLRVIAWVWRGDSWAGCFVDASPRNPDEVCWFIIPFRCLRCPAIFPCPEEPEAATDSSLRSTPCFTQPSWAFARKIESFVGFFWLPSPSFYSLDLWFLPQRRVYCWSRYH